MQRMRKEGLIDSTGKFTKDYREVVMSSDDGISAAIENLTKGTGVSEAFKDSMEAKFKGDRNERAR